MSDLTPNHSKDSADKNYEAGYREEPLVEGVSSSTKKPTFGSKVKRHCARFWWLHLIAFCVIFLIIALCLVYVAMPRIAQHDVNRSHLELTELQFLNPSEKTLTLSQKAILHSPSMYTPTLDPFNASLYLVTNGQYASTPMSMLTMPRIHALHPQSNATVEAQQVDILDQAEVAAYATAIMTQEEVTTALVGRTKLHEGKLPVTWVNYNTTLTYKGLNALKGFNVTNVRINASVPAGTPNLKGTAFIPNPSHITVELGNVTLILSTPSQGVIGNATINDMTLAPGNNTLPMTSFVNQTLVIQSLDSNGYITMQIVGNSSVYNGEHLPYYEQALANNKLSLQLNVKQILTDSAS
jgi:hypothetical protein